MVADALFMEAVRCRRSMKARLASNRPGQWQLFGEGAAQFAMRSVRILTVQG